LQEGRFANVKQRKPIAVPTIFETMEANEFQIAAANREGVIAANFIFEFILAGIKKDVFDEGRRPLIRRLRLA